MGSMEVLCASYFPLFIYLYIMGSTSTYEHYTSMKFHISCLNSVAYILIHLMSIENFKTWIWVIEKQGIVPLDIWIHWIAQTQEFLTPRSSPSSDTLQTDKEWEIYQSRCNWPKSKFLYEVVTNYGWVLVPKLAIMISSCHIFHLGKRFAVLELVPNDLSLWQNTTGTIQENMCTDIFSNKLKTHHESKVGGGWFYLGSNSWTWAISLPWASGQLTFLFSSLSWLPSTIVVFLRLLLRVGCSMWGPLDPLRLL